MRKSAGAFAFVALLSVCGDLFGQASRDEILRRVYPGASFQAERNFLTEEQMKKAAALSGEEIPTALIARYIAVSGGKVVGRAYVDTHIVRTKNESILVCLDAGGRVKRVEVTAFLEPPGYQPREAWYDQFRDRTLTGDLGLNRAIRPVAGATLTAKATLRAVRRILAINQVLS